MQKRFAIAVSLVLTSGAFAEEYPTMGIVYNTLENYSLNYDCRLDASNVRLHCRFIQTMVGKKVKPDELPQKLKEARSAYPNILKQMDGDRECAEIPAAIDALQGKVSAEDFLRRTNEKSPTAEDIKQFEKARSQLQQNSEMMSSLTAMGKFCDTKSEADYLAMVERQFQIDSRTCQVGSLSFEQEFKRVGEDAWVVDQGAQGECGIVQLSRFEAEKSGKVKFWNYVARKAVTLPDANTFFGKCSDTVDENEYRYSWISQGNLHLGCEWINFSQF